jgi:hypothetical protein
MMRTGKGMAAEAEGYFLDRPMALRTGIRRFGGSFAASA